MSLECGCRGANENCFRCQGSGYTGTGPSPSAAKRPQPRTLSNRSITPGSESKPTTGKTHLDSRSLTKDDVKQIQAAEAQRASLSLFKVRSKIDTTYREHISTSKPKRRRIKRGRKSTKQTTIGTPPGVAQSQAKSVEGKQLKGPLARARMSRLTDTAAERRLDGSRDYSQFRESGRFGSHPSFDSSNDE